MPIKHLVLGGARSGKSRFAERTALAIGVAQSGTPTYLATATALDSEMSERISQHQQQRQNAQWQLLEEPLHLGKQISRFIATDVVLIDCLTLWLSNCLHAENWLGQKQQFIEQLRTSKANFILVSNEVGNGIVPMGELSRKFVDESGWLHQEIAELCSDVTLVVAGIPTTLKSS